MGLKLSDIAANLDDRQRADIARQLAEQADGKLAWD